MKNTNLILASKALPITLLIILCLVVIGCLLYYFYYENKKREELKKKQQLEMEKNNKKANKIAINIRYIIICFLLNVFIIISYD